MSDQKSPNLLIYGRTLSSTWEKEQQARKADAQRRRKHQDAQFALSQQKVTSDGGFGVARLGSSRLITDDAPRFIMFYKNYGIEGISEVTWVPKKDIHGNETSEMEKMFTLVCIGCLRRGEPLENTQLMIRDSHRHFDIDDRPENKKKRFVEGFGMVTSAGKVTARDIIRCSNVNCRWAVRVIDSIVEEV